MVLEAGIGVALIHNRLLPSIGIATLLLTVCVHTLVFVQCSRRRKWAYGALMVLAPLSLLWWLLGKALLARLGISSFLVVVAFTSLRFGALALIRERTSGAWIESQSIGATFWLVHKPTIVLGTREKLMQILAAILLGPALIGYVTGWDRTRVFLCIVVAILLVVSSLVLARKRAP